MGKATSTDRLVAAMRAADNAVQAVAAAQNTAAEAQDALTQARRDYFDVTVTHKESGK